jgi:ABC-type transport system involved in multi-copper enzyme maturation permease subunit
MQTSPDLCADLEPPAMATNPSQMSGLLKKEIRQLLPGFLLGLPLVLFSGKQELWFLYPLSLVLLALSAFGREFSSGTFSNLLVMPISRNRIWRAKTIPLAIGFLAFWCLAMFRDNGFQFPYLFSFVKTPSLYRGFWPPWQNPHQGISNALIALAIFSGGLWTSLLLRQITAAFLITLLSPLAIYATIEALFYQKSQSLLPALCILATLIYSGAGFLLARWLFLRAQDAQWTGENLSMPALSLPSWGAATRRAFRPRLALLAKEIQLQNTQLAIAAGLLGLNLLANLVRGHCAPNSALYVLLDQFFWVLWLLLPLLIGAAAVAEERQWGTLGAQLCLPAPRRTQFAAKVWVVAFLSLVLGFCMPLALSQSLRELLAQSDLELSGYWRNFSYTNSLATGVWSIFLLNLAGNLLHWVPYLGFAGIIGALTLFAFFMSTLSRSVLQALALAIPTFIAAWALLQEANRHPAIGDYTLWFGPLIDLLGVPLLVALLVGLAYWNHQQPAIGWKQCRANFAFVSLALVFVTALTTALYHRGWELLLPSPRPQIAAKRIQTPVRMNCNYCSLQVTLPDGRILFTQLRSKILFSYWGDLEQDPAVAGGTILGGNRWKTLSERYGSFVGLTPEGTVWISQAPHLYWFGTNRPMTKKTTTMVPLPNSFGQGWKEMSQSSALWIKADGTLWRWAWEWTSGDWKQNFQDWNSAVRSGKFVPRQWGKDSDWDSFVEVDGATMLRKTNGEIWRTFLHRADDKLFPDEVSLEGQTYMRRMRYLEGRQWRNVLRIAGHGVGLCEDGSLREVFLNCDTRPYPWIGTEWDRPIGGEKDWVSAINARGQFVTLKADGTLWKWLPPDSNHFYRCDRFGDRSDWVGIASLGEGGPSDFGFLALAADGSLWLWGFGEDTGYHWLAHSRRPRYICSLYRN